ncbi:hypothetical protein [Neobacillus niacini]|uniref:hypothetical protein n=1 Tax=Neobacillus niacini TaxID=86668 RepID=UPI003983D7F9
MDTFKAVLVSNENDLSDEGLAFILNTLEYYQNQSVFHEFWKKVEDHESIYNYVMEFIPQHQDYSNLLTLILENRFKLESVEEILAEINTLLESSPALLRNRSFQILAIHNTANAVANSPDPYKAASVIQAFNLTNPEIDFSKLKEKLRTFTEIAIVDKIELHTITLDAIHNLALLATEKLTQIEREDKKVIRKYKILKVLDELFNTSVVSVGLVLQHLSSAEREELQEVLKNVLVNNLSERYFQHILAAFANEENGYHYPQLFGYLSKYANEEQMLSFIKWTANTLQLDHHYHRALKTYLKTHPRSIWKNKDARNELQMIASPNFIRLVKEVQKDKASPMIKFFKRFGMQVSIVLISVGACGSGLFLGYDLLFDQKEKTAYSKTGKPVDDVQGQVQVEVPNEAPSLEQFKHWDRGMAYVFQVNGEQQTITFGQANPTGGKSLVLSGGENSGTPFELVIDSKTSPFNEKGLLKDEFSLYHAEHDFDINGTPEVVIMALSQTYESFVWVYSLVSENGNTGLRRDLAINGMSDAKLAENTLALLGIQGQSETYTYTNQQFEKQ